MGGHDKNFLSLLLSMGASSLLAFVLFSSKGRSRFFQALCTILILFFILSSSMVYSRSGIFTMFLGLLIILAIYFFKQRKRNLIRSLLIIGIILFSLSLFFDSYLAAFPYWRITIERLAPQELQDFNSGRIDTLEKSIAIIEENPWIGVGAGMYKKTFIAEGNNHAVGTISMIILFFPNSEELVSS